MDEQKNFEIKKHDDIYILNFGLNNNKKQKAGWIKLL